MASFAMAFDVFRFGSRIQRSIAEKN